MWKSGGGGSASMCSLNSCERIRPERARNPIQRLVWGPGAQFQVGFAGLIEEELSCNPRVALRRLLRLYEGRQYREAANFLQRLPCYTFRASLPDIPVDLIVESLPQSLSLLEAIYSRLLELARTNEATESSLDDSTLMRIEQQVLWRVVHHISTSDNLRDAQIWRKLLVTLSRLSPSTKKLLASRRRSLERAVEGLGKHGLVPSNTNVEDRRFNGPTSRSSTTMTTVSTRVGTFANCPLDPGIVNGPRNSVNNTFNIPTMRTMSATITTTSSSSSSSSNIANISPGEPPTSLLPLTAKLRDELETRLEAYKLALHKIESWGKQNGVGGGGSGVVGGTRSKAGDRQVRAASHQRQLSLKYSEVQQRLIDNQSLLNILGKPSDRNLEDLIGELRRRVERDKEALRQWNAVRKSSGLSGGSGGGALTMKNPALAASLLQFSRACSLALRLMNESIDVPSGYQINGLPTREIEHFRDDRFETAESSSSAGYHTDDSCSPTPEPLVTEMTKNTTNNCADIDNDVGNYSWTTEQLTDRYVALYAHAHLHTLDALDALEPLKDATDLKAKILFSVVVLSWRVAEIVQASRRHEASKILTGSVDSVGCETSTTTLSISDSTLSNETTLSRKNATNGNNAHGGKVSIIENTTERLSRQFVECMNRQMARHGHDNGARQVADRVLSQLERTLYDFPCLRECNELRRYALACSSLAWICLARDNPLILDVAQGFANFDNEIHARHHASPDSLGTRIIAVLWPGLLLRETTSSSRTACLYRAVVLTALSHYAN